MCPTAVPAYEVYALHEDQSQHCCCKPGGVSKQRNLGRSSIYTAGATCSDEAFAKATTEAQPARWVQGKLKRVNAVKCDSRDGTPLYACDSAESPTPSWTDKPLICRGVHTLLGNSLPLAEVTKKGQYTGFTNAASANELIPELSAELVAVAGPMAIAGGAAGAITNILKLINGVCAEGLQFLGSCSARVSMTSITLAVTSLSLVFTGVGVPLSALLLGMSSIMTRRLGPMLCEKGFLGTLRSLGQVAYDTLKESVQSMNTIWDNPPRLQDLPKLAAKAASNFLRTFWSLLKNLASSVVKVVKAITAPGDDEATAMRQAMEKTCCGLQAARRAFSQIPQAELEVLTAVNPDLAAENATSFGEKEKEGLLDAQIEAAYQALDQEVVATVVVD